MQKAASNRAVLQRRLSVENHTRPSSLPHKESASSVQKPKRASLEKTSVVAASGKENSTAGVVEEPRSFQESDFEVGRKMGQGLFGHVYLARTRAEHKVVALKVLYKRALEEENVVPQLQREVEIHTRLRHPNIVRMYSYFHNRDKVILVLEYCPGGTLFDALKDAPERRFSEERAAFIVRQLCSALSVCHRFQIVHRDIKPENILIGKEGEVKLADFGWAVAHKSKDSRMRRQTLCGTVDYLAPEIVDSLPYDERVDAWSVGVLLFEMLVGRAPFSAGMDCETCDRISSCDVDIPDTVSPAAADLIARLLVKDPEQRMTVEQVESHPWIRGHAMDDMV